MTIKARLINSQFGLKFEGVKCTFRDIVGARTNYLTEDPDGDGVQRVTKQSRVKILKDDLTELHTADLRHTELITEFFHIELDIPSKLTVNTEYDLQSFLRRRDVAQDLMDGAGRFKTLEALVDEDPSWLDSQIYVQFYVNLDVADKIRLQEILNKKRATLEKNFGVYLESRYYDVSDTGIAVRHKLSSLAVRLSQDKMSPLRGKTKFHFSTHTGVAVSAVQQAIKVALARADMNIVKKDEFDYDSIYSTLRGSLRALAACTDDAIFGENVWAEWIPASGAMLNVMLSGMVYAAKKYEPTSEKVLIQTLCDEYGVVFRQFMTRKEIGVNKFTNLGGRQGNDQLWVDLKAAIDAV